MKHTTPQYKTVKSSEREKAKYADLMKSAIDKAEQAISCIQYSSFPQVNAELIKKIQDACRILEDALECEIDKVI